MTTMSILLLRVFAASAIGQTGTNNSSKRNLTEIVKRMKQALEPAIPSIRVMTLKV
jgi:hypothetical protein